MDRMKHVPREKNGILGKNRVLIARRHGFHQAASQQYPVSTDLSVLSIAVIRCHSVIDSAETIEGEVRTTTIATSADKVPALLACAEGAPGIRWTHNDFSVDCPIIDHILCPVTPKPHQTVQPSGWFGTTANQF